LFPFHRDCGVPSFWYNNRADQLVLTKIFGDTRRRLPGLPLLDRGERGLATRTPFAVLVVGLWSMEVALIDRRESNARRETPGRMKCDPQNSIRAADSPARL
jgi:hypothetical protein